MKVIGVTGTSGSGKTEFCKKLSNLAKIEILDADKICRKLQKKDSEYYKDIVRVFGKKVLKYDGKFYKELDRKKMAEIIYGSMEAKEKLDEITFKYVTQYIKDRLEILKSSSLESEVLENKKLKVLKNNSLESKEFENKIEKYNFDFILIDAPTLYEAKLDKLCDLVIAIKADYEIKLERICKRDNISPETAEKRLAIQHDNSFYCDKADYVITNNSNEEMLKSLEALLEKLN